MRKMGFSARSRWILPSPVWAAPIWVTWAFRPWAVIPATAAARVSTVTAVMQTRAAGFAFQAACRSQDGFQLAPGAADEDGVGGGQARQGFRGFALHHTDVPAPQPAAVFFDQGAGLGQALHRIHRGAPVGKGQFQADTAGACPHVPGGFPGAESQLGQGLGPDGLFGHGDGLGPGEGAVGPAGGAGSGPGGRLGQQHRQGPEGPLCQLTGCAAGEGLIGAAQVLPHRHRQVFQACLGQTGAEVGGAGALAAGEEKHRPAPADGGHRVAAGAVGRHQLPVLPGPAQPGRQQLDAGNPRHHFGGDSILGQPFQQARRP